MDIVTENIQLGKKYDNTNVKLLDNNVPNLANEIPKTPKILLIRGDTISVAKTLIDNGITPCVLNFANNYNPGGNTSCKGNTQEEVIMRLTTLAGVLDIKHYPIDIVVDKYQYWDYKSLGLIYSPEVYVIRDSFYNLLKTPFKMAVVTCAAINSPKTSGCKYMFNKDREVTRRKIQMILDTASLKGHDNLVAGQWGCGAFNNPLEICELWIEEISKRNIRVAFPIFNKAFGDTMRELLEKTKI